MKRYYGVYVIIPLVNHYALRLIGKKCVWGLADRVGVRGVAMQLSPHRCLAPFGRSLGPGALREGFMQQADALVGGHRPQHLRRPLGALRVDWLY